MLESIIQNINLNYFFLGNSIKEYFLFSLTALIIVIVLIIIKKLVLNQLSREIKKRDREEEVITVFVRSITDIHLCFYFYLSIFLAINLLRLSERMHWILSTIFLIWIVVIVVRSLQHFIDYGLNKNFVKEDDPSTKVAVKNISWIIKLILWLLAGLFVLSNLGINVTAFITGLGVGGVAIAFALRNILEDLFSSFTIYFDKPFTVGDFIIVNDKKGIVEEIGLVSTRLRALQGEEIVISNQELTEEQVHNFHSMERRREVFEFGVAYNTSHEKMQKIPDIVQDIITDKDNVEFDRTHFKGFGDSALEFEVSYYILSADFEIFRDIHESILLDIKKQFEKEQIEMAFPTRTVHLFKE